MTTSVVSLYQQYHFIGIGGIGMSALAQMLLRKGYRVSGSDIRAGHITKALELMGATIFIGHRPKHLQGADCVVYSSSVKDDNPELIEARKLEVPVKHRSQMLALLSEGKRMLAVSGTHGKTTTTAMVGWIYEKADVHPTVIVGGHVRHFGGNLLMGSGSEMILEADESDASFLEYSPEEIILTNIENDHMDYFKNMANIEDKYRAFLDRMKPAGKWYGSIECPVVKRLLTQSRHKTVSFGFDNEADYAAENLESLGKEGMRFHMRARDRALGELHLGLPGRHNVLNALGAAALAYENGIGFQVIREALESFQGTTRRFDVKLDTKKLIIIDDYAHHPTEIKRTLEAAKGYAKRRIVVIFQPHRFSRTQSLQNEFSQSFQLADEVIVTDVYGAGEKPIEGVSGMALSQNIHKTHSGEVSFAPRADVFQAVQKSIQSGDMVLTLGAGDITQLAEELSGLFHRVTRVHEMAVSLQDLCPGVLKPMESMARHTSIKIGGEAECWFEPEDVASLAKALRIAKQNSKSVHVVGAGSNVLISDAGLEGLIVHLSQPAFKHLDIDATGNIVAGGAVALSTFLGFVLDHGMGDCEFLMGIPAQIGGAVFMNAGSSGKWIGSYLVRLTAVNDAGEIIHLEKKDIPFDYRQCGLTGLIITEATFSFPMVPREKTLKNLHAYAEHRRKTQDLIHPSAGCMFRNPKDQSKSAGYLIEKAGLKGKRLGQAQISEIHANFVVNLGGATQQDVLSLLELAQDSVLRKFRVRLEREIRVIS